jgi:hypothetical protein
MSEGASLSRPSDEVYVGDCGRPRGRSGDD